MKNIFSSLLFGIFFLSVAFQANAQDVPSPGAVQSETIVLRGATIHVGNGEVIENGVIVLEDGKIKSVSKSKTLSTGENSIDLSGKHIYPGLITPNSLLGMVEINAVRATKDNREVGRMNPHVRSIIAYNTDSKVIPTVRSNGVLLAQIKPEGGRISGKSSVVQLDAWNWEDAIVKEDDGIYLNWPTLFQSTGWWAEPGPTKLNDKYDEQVDELRSFLAAASTYSKSNKDGGQENLKLAAMNEVIKEKKKIYLKASQHKQLIDAIQISKELGLNIVLVGARDAWLVLDIIKENNIPIILQQTHSLPGMEDDDVDLPFKLPVLLQEAGIKFCMSAENGYGAQRNLPFTIGKSVAYGLSKEDALSAVTLNTAEILGVDDVVGSLEVGKDATLIVSTGDVLDVVGNNIEHAFIQGRKVNLANKQKDLYMKYMDKYELDYEAP